MKALVILVSLLFAISSHAADLRIAVLDFDNVAEIEDNDSLSAIGDDDAIAEKGALILNQLLTEVEGVRVVDRRDFMRKLEKEGIDAEDGEEHIEPSFIHAAQLLRVDSVLRGTLMSVSRQKRLVNPTKDGDPISFETITVRVMIQALDTIDGSVLAAAQGKQSVDLRQTDVERIEMGSDELLTMIEKGLEEAVKDLSKPLAKKLAARADSDSVGITVTSTDDPALVEIDGVLVGSTPLEGLQVYKGDHVLKVSRPNYVTITKRIVLKSDAAISVPMLRKDLTPEERMEIYKGAEMKVYMTNGKPDLLIQTLD